VPTLTSSYILRNFTGIMKSEKKPLIENKKQYRLMESDINKEWR